VNPRQAGRVLGGRYELIREIARGGMAIVWEAKDALLDRHVALKLLTPQLADDLEFLERFRREARAAAKLSHPNIVPIFDVGEDAETHTPFIVMELVEGGNLKDRIRAAAPLSNDEVRSIGVALASTLEYAHRRGIIHRDVKPQNVLLGDDGRPRLTDFGIAQAMSSTGLTRTGAVMGSVHYLAPELVRGRQALPQSDVYALGAVLYEMATGRVPFEGETDLAIAVAHVEETPAAPRALNAHLAPDLERSILRALAKSPEQRFLSATELASELRDGISEAPRGTGSAPGRTEAVTQRMSTVAAPPRRQRPPEPVAAGAAAGAGPTARRTARPRQKRGTGGGLLVLLLSMAAVLVALGAGFFGIATLSREGVATPEPTTRPTSVPKAVLAPTNTPQPSPSPTAEPTATPQPTPSPRPSPTSPPPTPTPAPPTPTLRAIAIPQLRGKTLEEAQLVLKTAGLTTTVRGINANADKDMVADQSPDAGTTLPPGGTVTILVGTGATALPDVSNTPRDQAVKALQSNSFRVTVRQRRDQRVPEGVAIETRPPFGSIIPRGTEVELTVSSGR
jgi:serine/threonine-protein kinase